MRSHVGSMESIFRKINSSYELRLGLGTTGRDPRAKGIWLVRDKS